jgi:hypothetical protein
MPLPSVAPEASEIERCSDAVQRLDMLWGVAQEDEKGCRGVIVCSRPRHSDGFEPAQRVEFDAEEMIEAIR